MAHTFAARSGTWLAAAGALFAALSGAAFAADAQGCKDPDGLKRFEGSRIVLCDDRKFEEATVGAGPVVNSEDFTAKFFETKVDVEGRSEKSIYVIPAGPSEAEVFRNYQDLMTGRGFELLYAAKGDEAGSALDFILGKSFNNVGALMSSHADGQRFGTFVKKDAGGMTYATVFVRQGEPGSHPEPPTIDSAEGEIVVRVDVVYAGQMKDQMVLVKASDMQKALDDVGRISLYGILFDFNKSDIKPESRAALDEIAKFLKDNPARKVRVVGHTDSVGGPEFNMKLCQARASAVVADLTAQYGIDAGRLTGEGAGLTAPVASNDSDAGRAKNRRVELVAVK